MGVELGKSVGDGGWGRKYGPLEARSLVVNVLNMVRVEGVSGEWFCVVWS